MVLFPKEKVPYSTWYFFPLVLFPSIPHLSFFANNFINWVVCVTVNCLLYFPVCFDDCYMFAFSNVRVGSAIFLIALAHPILPTQWISSFSFCYGFFYYITSDICLSSVSSLRGIWKYWFCLVIEISLGSNVVEKTGLLSW